MPTHVPRQQTDRPIRKQHPVRESSSNHQRQSRGVQAVSQKLPEKFISATSNDAKYPSKSDSDGGGRPCLRQPHKRRNGTTCATAVARRGTLCETLSHLFLRRFLCGFCPLLTSRTSILQPAYRHLLLMRLPNLGGRGLIGVELEEDEENRSKNLGDEPRASARSGGGGKQATGGHEHPALKRLPQAGGTIYLFQGRTAVAEEERSPAPRAS